MNDSTVAVQKYSPGPLSAVEIRAQVNLIQEVMQAVMKDRVHYGTIPGTPKPTLYKPGAEKIFATFRIAVDEQIDADLSTDDVFRYRTRSIATDPDGNFLGSALGACSSNEEKYKWRSALCHEEWEVFPEDRRRIKFRRNGQKVDQIEQVRTEPADVENTILKMAAKRSYVALCLRVTGASDVFAQDLEDLPEEVRSDVTGSGGAAPQSTARTISGPQRKRMYAIARGKSWAVEKYRAFVKLWGFNSDKDVTSDVYEAMVSKIEVDHYEGPDNAAPDSGREPGQEG